MNNKMGLEDYLKDIRQEFKNSENLWQDGEIIGRYVKSIKSYLLTEVGKLEKDKYRNDYQEGSPAEFDNWFCCGNNYAIREVKRRIEEM